jgi:chemotaxis protein methyltransferase CheR
MDTEREFVFPDGSSEAWSQAKLQPREYERLSKYIEDLCGIRIPPSKQILLEARLRRRLRALGMSNFQQYCDHVLSSGMGIDEIIPMVDEVTTNKTDFFREPFHFDYLTNHALPALVQTGAGSRRDLQAWSAACSSGEEPYTLSMVLADFGQLHFGFHFQVLGTDICTEVLDQARRGVYTEDSIEPIPFLMRDRYLLRSKDRRSKLVRVVPHLRATATFRRLNFLDRDYQIDPAMDVVFCRNVLIYFSRETQEAVCWRICQHIRPGGYFFLGHSESLQGMDLPLRAVAPTVYRKDF